MRAPTTDDPLIGATLCGKWTLLRPLGAGGTALVYEARHRNGKLVAVKMLRLELAHKKEARSRFLREGYLANRVGHPGALSVLDDDVDEAGRPFLVTELLRGETLDRRWKGAGRRLEAAFALRVVDRVLEVLAAAHEAGVVHRDVKPGNVFLADDGSVKLLDFGLARAGPSASTTRSDATLGTPAFMAPEQARGHWGEVDQRSDLWSVGATLYALLGGTYVHTHASGNETLVAAATQRAPSLALRRPDLPAALVAVVDRALAFDKAERHASAEAMRRALREAADDLPPEAPGHESTYALSPEGERGVAPPSPLPSSSALPSSRSTRPETEESLTPPAASSQTAPPSAPSQIAAPAAPPSGRSKPLPAKRPSRALARFAGPITLLAAVVGTAIALWRAADPMRIDATTNALPALPPSASVTAPAVSVQAPPDFARAEPASSAAAPALESAPSGATTRSSASVTETTGTPPRRPRGPATASLKPTTGEATASAAPPSTPLPSPSPAADAPRPAPALSATPALRPDAELLDRRK